MTINSTRWGGGFPSLSSCLATLMLLLFVSTSTVSASPYVFVGDDGDRIDWTQPVEALTSIMNAALVKGMAKTTNASNFAAQCFIGFSAGNDASYCFGETAILDGGYDSYGFPGLGSDDRTITWSIAPNSGGGDFMVGASSFGNSISNSTTLGGSGNFATSSNGIGSPVISYQPISTDSLVVLILTVSSTGGDCDVQTDEVRLFFKPELRTQFTLSGNGVVSTNDATEICSGEIVDLEIANPAGPFPDDPEGSVPHYSYTITDPSGAVSGFPTSGVGEAGEFDAAFNNLTLTNTTGASADVTISVMVFYDRDNDDMVDGNECEGTADEVTITVFPQAQATVSVNNGTNNLFCEDEIAEFRITGSPNSTVTYRFDLDDGNGFGTDQTITLGASGTNGGINGEAANLITLTLAGRGGDSIRIRLTEVEYTVAPTCPRTLNFTRGIRVVDTPTGSISLTSTDDTDFCNGDFSMGSINYTFTTTSGAGSYELAVEESINGGASASSSYSVITVGGPSSTGTFAIAYPASASAGQTVTYTLTGISESGSGLSCGGNVTGQTPITVIEQPDPELTFDATAAGTTASVDNSTSGTLTVCDGTAIDFDNVTFPASLVTGDDPMIELTITDDTENFFGGNRTLTLAEVMDLDTTLNIPNNVTVLQTITLTFTPFYESDAVTGITGNDCFGNNSVLTINIQPAITASLSSTPAASPAITSVNDSVTVCTGEDVVFTINSSADGSANVVVANGPNQIVTISGGVGTFTLSNVQNNTSFTLVDVTANGCTAEFNETIDVIEEEVPTATITVNNGDLCNGGSDTLNLTAIGGEGPDFSYTIEGRDPSMGVIPFMQIDGSSSEIVELTGLTTPGTYSYYVTSVFNNNGAPACGTIYTIGVDAPVVTVTVEEVARIAVSSNIFSGNLASTIMVDNASSTTSDTNNEICSGDDVELTFTDQSVAFAPDTGDSLYYLLTLVQDETQTLASGFSIVATSDELGGNPILSQAFVNTSATVEANVSFLAYGFYASSRPTPADALAGNGGFCYGEELAFSFAVLPTPEADFGSNQTICFNSDATVDFTGTPDAEVTVEVLQGDAMTGTLAGVGTTDIITLSSSGSAFFTTGIMTENLVLRITQVESADGCINTEILDVTIVVLPENDAEFTTAGPVDACEGVSASLDITATPDSRVYYTVGMRLDSIDVPASGMATLMTNPLASDSTFTIIAVGKTVTNQSGNPVTCINTIGVGMAVLAVTVNVEAAPLGRITAVEPVCNDAETPQLRFDTTGTFVGDNFTIEINGIAYNNVADGDIITVMDSLTVDTDYNLESIVNTTIGGNNCVDVVDGTISTTTVIVEAIPTATGTITAGGIMTPITDVPGLAFEFDTTVCSGTNFEFSIVGAPLASSTSDPIAYSITVNDPGNLLGFGSFTDDLTQAQFDAVFGSQVRTLDNTTGSDQTFEVTFTPYYETTASVNPNTNSGPSVSNSCPGEAISFQVTVLDEISADFVTAGQTICQDSTATINFIGSPDIEISFFDGINLITVETDGAGDASYTTAALTSTTTFTITGFATTPPDQECFNSVVGGPTHVVTVTPTPTLAVDMNASDLEICNDGSDAIIGLTSNSANAVVTYSIGAGPDQTFTLTGTTGSLVISGLTQDTVVNFSLVTTSASPVPVCPAPLNIDVAINVRDLPMPVLTNNGPVCAGGLVGLIFTDTAMDVTGPYRFIVVGPAGATYTGASTPSGGGRLFTGVTSGTEFTQVSVAGNYSITAIRDLAANPPLSPSGGCAPVADPNGLTTTTIVIDEEPNLSALVASQAGVLPLTQGGINAFNTTVCFGENIDVDFQSTNGLSNSNNPLLGAFNVTSDPNGILSGYLPAQNGTLPLAALNFDEDLTTAGTVSFTITPYYEADGTPGISGSECTGRTLSFSITVLPELMAEITTPVDNSTAVCDGDLVTYTITGTEGADVTFLTTSLDNISPASPATIPTGGILTVTGNANFSTSTLNVIGFTTFELTEVSETTMINGVNKTCTETLTDEDVDVAINQLPTGSLELSDNGPLCAGEEVTVIFRTSFGPGTYTVTVNGTDYTRTVNPTGSSPVFVATLFMDTPMATDTFDLEKITFDPTGTGCMTLPQSPATFLDREIIMVNDVPAGTVTATDMNALVTTATSIVAGPAIVCTGDSLTLDADFDAGVITPVGFANYVSVNYDGSGNFFGQPAGPTGTIAIPVADFTTEFSARFQNLTNNVQTASLEITYYFETNGNDTLDMGECVGETVFLDIEIQPNPIATDVATTICSNEAVDFDLSAAITNGVTGVSYTYTVDPSASGLVDTNRVAASPANIVIPAGVLANTTTMDQSIVFTVTPATGATLTTPGCTGNDFTFTLTVQPAPALDDNLDVDACSQEDIGIVLGTIAGPAADSFDIVSITPSTTMNFTPRATNAGIGRTIDASVIALDTFTNFTSVDQTVTYAIAPVAANGCIGDTIDVVATINPEPFVMNLRDTVCSGVRLDVDIIQDLVLNQVGRPASVLVRRQRLAGVQNFFVLDGSDNDDQVNFNVNGLEVGGENAYSVISDSLINLTGGGIDLVYNIRVNNIAGCGRNEFTYTLRVVPEATATLTPVASASFCTGEDITLNAGIMGGSAPSNIQYAYSVLSADTDVQVILTPSGSSVNVAAGPMTASGSATIAVTVSDAATGCTATATQVVTVGVTPEDNPIVGSERPCANTFSQYLVRDRGNSYSWNLSNPSAAQVIPSPADTAFTVVFNSNAPSGPFIITMTETSPDGCENEEDIVINLVQSQVADFFFQLNSGGDPLTVAFTDNSDGTISDYNWTFGDMGQFGTSTMENPTVTFPDNPVTPGSPYDIEVTLSVAGLCSNVPSTITKIVTVNSAVVCDDVNLSIGVNFITFNVEPTDSAIANVFAGVPGLQQVIGYANGFPQRFSPNGGGTNTPGMVVSKGAGYVVIVNQASVLTACGLPIDPNFKRPLNAGVNYVGYMGIQQQSADSYFANISDPFGGTGELIVARTFGSDLNPFTQTYTQTGGGANSLGTMLPGRGYLVVVNAAVGSYLGVPGNTESFDFIHGSVTGANLVAGSTIDILNSQGEAIGQIVTDSEGNFVATPIFGEVIRADGSFADGLQAQEELSFRYNGMTVSSDAKFNGNWAVTEINLDFSEAVSTEFTATVEFGMTLAPNPVGSRATITLNNQEAGSADVLLMDVNGRVVAKVFSTDALPIGQTQVEWNEAGSLTAGVYSIIVLRNGRLVKEATQRVVKQ